MMKEMDWFQVLMHLGMGFLLGFSIVGMFGTISRIEVGEEGSRAHDILRSSKDVVDRGVAILRMEEKLLDQRLREVDSPAWSRLYILNSAGNTVRKRGKGQR